MKRLLIFIIVLIGCRDSDQEPPFRTANLMAPVSTGLYITNDFLVLEEWRKPEGKAMVYPSISRASVFIRFEVLEGGPNTVWVTPARMNDDNAFETVGNGLNIVAPGTAIWYRTIDSPINFEEVLWDLTNQDGQKVKRGIYRVFVQTKNTLQFGDMFVYHDCSDIPSDINSITCN